MPTNNFTSDINSAVSSARCRAFETAFCFSLFKISLIYFIFQNRRIYSVAHQKQKFLEASHILCPFNLLLNLSYVANLKATFHDCEAIIYSYARQKQEFLGAVHLCKSKICASGAIFAASLTSKLADSALLDYQFLRETKHLRLIPRFRQTLRTKESRFQGK